jgi:O-antigen/teichoic acid export membrane protein
LFSHYGLRRRISLFLLTQRSSMSLKRDTLWNIAGGGIPLLAGVLSVPFMIAQLGNERFGIVTLIWALIGYFGLFDLGVGRALTIEISKLRARGHEGDLADVLHAGLLVTLATGAMGAVIMLSIASHLSRNWLDVSPQWQADTQAAFQIAAVGIMPTTVASGVRGALEGFGRFAASNAIRIFLGFCMFTLPALSLLLHGNSLWCIALYLVAARVAAALLSFVWMRPQIFVRSNLIRVRRKVRPLLSFGVWITVSGVVGPMMVYGDRFFVAAAVSADQLPFYAIPQEGLQRLLIIPIALVGALLPRFASSGGSALVENYKANYRRVCVAMFLACTAAALVAGPFLTWWISPAFSERATPIVLILAIAIWFNSMAQLPYTILHAHGRTKVTAMFHLGELGFYMMAVYWLTTHFGLIGAAIAWLARAALDLVLLNTAAYALLKKQGVLAHTLIHSNPSRLGKDGPD